MLLKSSLMKFLSDVSGCPDTDSTHVTAWPKGTRGTYSGHVCEH